jgi:hypothetical protein
MKKQPKRKRQRDRSPREEQQSNLELVGLPTSRLVNQRKDSLSQSVQACGATREGEQARVNLNLSVYCSYLFQPTNISTLWLAEHDD